ncbi:histidinol-phosphate transaminase [Primorskyibacter sp. S187A]|uniref:histidinol-phosphate transaminase n=1 Tax=Primorskyibacter sp. S187A TaxID=3415130 RepID=UPI003C7C9D51
MTGIKPQPGIMDIALYVGGKSTLEGVSDVIKLSSNENPFGPSPKAQDALVAAARDLHRYPSTDHASLRSAIAQVHGLQAENIICGVGSDEIIHFLCQAYVGAGDEVIHTEHGFAMYRISTLAAGGTPVEVAECDRRVDVDRILAAVTPATRLVFIANPANPTATFVPMDEITRLAEALPDHVILVLDGAYAEFEPGYDGGAQLAETRANVVMTRTFSKLYGLGGLRVGYGYADRAIIDVLNRIRGPFNLSGPALAAAEAAVLDHAFTEHCLAENARLRRWLREALLQAGVACDESHANFVLARFETSDEADAANAHLQSLGLIVRQVGGYKLPACLRITVGDETACQRVAEAITTFKKAQAA